MDRLDAADGFVKEMVAVGKDLSVRDGHGSFEKKTSDIVDE
jgi:hypothetical protein